MSLTITPTLYQNNKKVKKYTKGKKMYQNILFYCLHKGDDIGSKVFVSISKVLRKTASLP